MSEEPHLFKWRIVGKSVQGASHKRASLPNQDAIDWFPQSGAGLPLILAVSDGHGSAKSFRSDEGACLAVTTATTVMQDFLKGQPDLTHHSAIKRTAEERLPQELVRRWEKGVNAYLDKTPFSPEELNALEKKEGARARQLVETNPLLAYGATLLAVLVTESFIVYLQLGDGDILAVSEMGEVSRPLRKDERLFANETTSLCSRNAWHDFQVSFQTLSGSPPALILLATDGYANSFRDEKGFLKVGSDLLKMIRADGLDTVNENLEVWLSEASQVGSGDDITLGIICRMSVLQRTSGQEIVEHSQNGEDEVQVEDSQEPPKQSPELLAEKSQKVTFGEQPQ